MEEGKFVSMEEVTKIERTEGVTQGNSRVLRERSGKIGIVVNLSQ